MADFEEWAKLANDTRWSYNGLLPYFRSTETYWTNETNYLQHGHTGPLEIEVPTTTGRIYPLRDAVYASFEDVGVEALPGLDANAGDNIGIGQIAEVSSRKLHCLSTAAKTVCLGSPGWQTPNCA